jgi:outer membrane receptor protein involved in Fe transport
MNIGLRLDHYAGLVTQTAPQPRLALSYMIRQTGTVLRAAYSRTMETPFNENLLLSSATGAGGLAQNIFGARASVPLEPGARNQFNGGFQQKVTTSGSLRITLTISTFCSIHRSRFRLPGIIRKSTG